MKKVIIKAEAGIHARPASKIVQKCTEFESQIYLIKDEKKADARSIMNLLSMAITCNDEIIVEAVGSDSVSAEEAIAAILESGV